MKAWVPSATLLICLGIIIATNDHLFLAEDWDISATFCIKAADMILPDEHFEIEPSSTKRKIPFKRP